MSLPVKDNVLYRFARGPFDDFDDSGAGAGSDAGSAGAVSAGAVSAGAGSDAGSAGIGIGVIDEILGRLGLLRRHGWIVDGLGVDAIWFADEYDMNVVVVPNVVVPNVVVVPVVVPNAHDRRGVFAALPSRGVSFVSATFAPSWEWAVSSTGGAKNVVMAIRVENRDEAIELIRTAKESGYVFVAHLAPKAASTSVMVFVDTPSAKTLSIRGVHTVNPENLLKF